MSRFPLSGLARPVVVAAASAVALTVGSGLTAETPAHAHPTSSFAGYIAGAHDAAMACRLDSAPGDAGLRPWPSTVRNRVAAQFDITDIGGYRPGAGSSDHHSGRAIDIMVRGERGTEIADWVRANARQLNVKYVIWQQGYWRPGMTSYRPMADRGSATANHWDHVHVSFRPGSGSCPSF